MAMADENIDELQCLFEKAADHLKSLVGKLDSDKLLYLYARFKQAKEGPCSIPKPGFFDFQGKQKWEAWKKLGNKTKESAMEEYVEEINNLSPGWIDKCSDPNSQPVQPKSGMGVSVSTMSNPDEDIPDTDKTVFDFCAGGDVKAVARLLPKMDINAKDSEGMSLLHWACDRGDVAMVTLLLKHKANVNIQDAEKQTGLHYGCSCEHEPVVKLLLKHKADVTISDSDGQLPWQVTDNQDIRALFNT